MKRFKNILFLADRDKGLSASLDRAVDIANANGARLTVMDVTTEIGIADYIQRTYSTASHYVYFGQCRGTATGSTANNDRSKILRPC